jgi:hypothetical protein
MFTNSYILESVITFIDILNKSESVHGESAYEFQGGIFIYFNIKIPITLVIESNHQQRYKSMIISYSSNLEQSMFTDNDLPSSYEKVCAICFWREKKTWLIN